MKIAFLGDIYLDDDYIKCKDSLLKGIKSKLKKFDFVVANLEAPITKSSQKIPKVGPNLKMSSFPEEILEHIDVFSLANNHIMDYSDSGLEDTIDFLKSKGKLYFGAGVDLDSAYKETVLEKDNVSVALIGMAENEFSLTFGNMPGVAPLDPIYSYRRIKNAVDKYDNVVIYIHGGNEFSALPSPRYKQLCKMYLDIGVSAVISSHTHIIGPVEEYSGKPIFYSLGNCLFNSKKPPEGWNSGLIASLGISNENISYDYYAFKQSIDFGGVKSLTIDEEKMFDKKFISFCESISDNEKYSNMWSEFIDSNSEMYLFRATSPFVFKGAYRLFSLFGINKLFYKKSSKLLKQNYISCESHREVVLDSFSKEK